MTKLASLALAVVATAAASQGCHSGSSDTGGTSSPVFTLSPPAGTTLVATAGAPFSQTLQVVSGGGEPYQFKLLSTSTGLTVAAVDSFSATLSGAPTTPGSAPVQLQVTDGTLRVVYASYVLRVDPAAPTLALQPASLPNGQRPFAYTQFLTAVGGVAPFAWTINGSLPPGLSFDASTQATAAIRGTPTEPGTSSFTVTVTDSSSPPRTGTVAYTVIIN